MQQVIRTLAAHAAFFPEKPAILTPEQLVTYRMLVAGVYSVQATVNEMGLDREKPVALLVDNPARHMIIALGLMSAGFTIASLRPDLIPAAQDAGFSVFITDGARYALPIGAKVISADERWFTRAPARPSKIADFPDNRIARIVFSSGSTGRPKAVAWTLPVLLDRLEQMSRFRVAMGDRSLCTYGMSASGFQLALWPLFGGRTVCFAPASQILEFAQAYQISGLVSTHSQLRGLLEQQRQKRLDVTFHVVSLGCGAVTRDLQSEIRNAFGTRVITSTYAATEFGYGGISTGYLLASGEGVGNCFAPVAIIRILDDNGNELPPGQVGQVFIASGSIGVTYDGNLDVAPERVPNSVSTGDLGYLDDNGLFFLTGRANEVINAGGASFDPEVLEAVLRRMPGLTDVAAIRITLPGAAPEPWLTIASDREVELQAIHRWMSSNAPGELGGVSFARLVRLDEIPKTGNGKVARQKLREQLVAAAGGAA